MISRKFSWSSLLFVSMGSELPNISEVSALPPFCKKIKSRFWWDNSTNQAVIGVGFIQTLPQTKAFCKGQGLNLWCKRDTPSRSASPCYAKCKVYGAEHDTRTPNKEDRLRPLVTSTTYTEDQVFLDCSFNSGFRFWSICPQMHSIGWNRPIGLL